MEFISHGACKSLHDIIWKGNYDRSRYCTIFPSCILHNFFYRKISDDVVKAKTFRSCLNIGPRFNFYSNSFFLCCFIFLFSWVCLTNMDKDFEIIDFVLLFWIINYFFEEVRQLLSIENKIFSKKFKIFFSDFWNVLDAVCVFLFFFGFIFKILYYYYHQVDEFYKVYQILYPLSLFFFYLRMLQILTPSKTFGPKIIMIIKMVIELIWFLVILFIAVLGYGIALQSMLYPNTKIDTTIFKKVFYKAYFQIHGEFFLDEIDDDSCKNEINCPSSHGSFSAHLLLAFYILLTNVLMLNLIIAMFRYIKSFI